MAEELLAVLLRLDSRMASIESRMSSLESTMTAGFASMNSRISALESTVALDSNLVALRGEMLSNFDGVYDRFGRLESEYHALTAAMRRIEDQQAREN